jgi:hypothetical protein
MRKGNGVSEDPHVKVGVDASEFRKAIEEASRRGYMILPEQKRPPVRKDTWLILVTICLATAVILAATGSAVGSFFAFTAAAVNFVALLVSSGNHPYEP